MMRRRTETHANHERWVLSYADFVTLMFALFVAMYAITLKDHTSGQRVSESVKDAVQAGGLSSAVELMFGKSKDKANLSAGVTAQQKGAADPSLLEPYQRLNKELKSEIESGGIRLHLETRGLVITLQEKTFFPSGGDLIYDQAYPSIDRVAKTIAGLSNPVRLEGHTDSVPINSTRFRNNWELSTARSIALLQLFQSKFGLDPGKFEVAGYAQNVPVASNDTEEGRARNRRVEIVILSRQNSPVSGGSITPR